MRLPLLVLHVSGGIVAMVAGAAAISFRKGSTAHRRAGNIFVLSMLTVSAVGSSLGFMKSEADNFLGGIFAFYLVATAWATARRGDGEGWNMEWIAPLIALTFGIVNFIWGVEVAHGQTAVKDQSPAGSYFFFGTLSFLCVAGDVRMLLRGLSSTQRLVRHLWRMCFGWFIATISFFLGQQRLFPAWLRRSNIQVLLAFLPLLFLVFWFIRVRFTGWAARSEWADSGGVLVNVDEGSPSAT